MAETDCHQRVAKTLCPRLCSAVQEDERFASLVLQYLNFAPNQADYPGAERLRRGLLAREASRSSGKRPRQIPCSRSVQTRSRKRSPTALHRRADTLNLNNIDAAL